MHQKSKEDYVFGLHSVLEALRSTQDIDKLFVNKSLNRETLSEISALAKERKVAVLHVPLEKLNRITRKNHQGVIAFVSSVQYAEIENVVAATYEAGKTPLILALDGITDVRNFGAIARTAECAGVDAILVPTKGSAQIGSDALKTSSGALNFIPVCKSSHFRRALDDLKESGLQIVACTEKSNEEIYSGDFSVPTVIVMGSEENGVSREVLEMADVKAKIPMFGKVGSMNVSVACGVILFEAIRQRQLSE